MKKHILLLLFCQLNVFAQNFKGVIKNEDTQEPIAQITLFNEDYSFL